MHVAAVPTRELLTRNEAARYLSLSPMTLRRWAASARGPRYVRSGPIRGKTLYAVADLDAWLEGRKLDPEAGTKGGRTK